MVFVWMEFKRQFPVGFLEVIVTGFFADAEHFIVVFTMLYSEGQIQRVKQSKKQKQ